MVSKFNKTASHKLCEEKCTVVSRGLAAAPVSFTGESSPQDKPTSFPVGLFARSTQPRTEGPYGRVYRTALRIFMRSCSAVPLRTKQHLQEAPKASVNGAHELNQYGIGSLPRRSQDLAKTQQVLEETLHECFVGLSGRERGPWTFP